MIGIDSNVIIRHLTGDDPDQTAKARVLLGSLSVANPGVLTAVGVAETYWTLRRVYKLDRLTVCAGLETLISAKEIVVERQDVVRKCLHLVADGGDLGDALIALISADLGCSRTMTFDRGAAKHAGMTLIE